jgi:hypothetical protein
VTLNRYAKRRDANESELVSAARRIGLKVFHTSELGDLLVQFGAITELWEVKGEKGKLTDAQCRMRQQGLTARTVRTVEDVIGAKGEMMSKLKAIKGLVDHICPIEGRMMIEKGKECNWCGKVEK